MIWSKKGIISISYQVFMKSFFFLKFSHLVSPTTQFILNGRYLKRIEHVTARQKAKSASPGVSSILSVRISCEFDVILLEWLIETRYFSSHFPLVISSTPITRPPPASAR